MVSSIPKEGWEASTAVWVLPKTAASAFRYMRKSKICKQRLIGWRSWAGRRSCHQPKCQAVPSWPCSPTQPAILPGFLWESRLVNDSANSSSGKLGEEQSSDLQKTHLDWPHPERTGCVVLSDGRRNEAGQTGCGRRSDATVGISRVPHRWHRRRFTGVHAAIYFPSHLDSRCNSVDWIRGRSRCEPGPGWRWMVQRDVCANVRRSGMGRSVAAGYARPEFAALVDSLGFVGQLRSRAVHCSGSSSSPLRTNRRSISQRSPPASLLIISRTDFPVARSS